MSVFASGSADKKVKIWDLMRVGFEIPKDLGGTDELLFTHEGHKGAVNEVNWHPGDDVLGSVGEDNTLQFYQIVLCLQSRPTTSMSWSTRRTSTTCGGSALRDWVVD